MQFSKSTDYALHALFHLAYSESNQNVGVKELSSTLGVSESYLSKIMSKLRQDGIVRAVPGVKGGYELARTPEQITFFDVIQVIEGRQQMFECSNSKSQQHQLLANEGDGLEEQEQPKRNGCLIEQVMKGAEQRLYEYLQEKTIQFVVDEAIKRGWNPEANKK
ncbi:RrF2 family transcriptional regulator [Bacillus horti]|uniref:Rrf2 family protein n=1 Tax=Caldalkalibacillus horti TaxID=77523 RepID=A0ABT9VXL3_9BACI|nr:Rrf2 family transcriptional regulator [Bacillus horti]MDQ0165733.1 Rrf2 family protein [Bacillus horti]